METAEPPQEALAPTAAILGFMRGSQAPAPGPEAPESPSYEEVEGRRHSETSWGELRNASGFPAEIMPPFPKDSSADKETYQETPGTNQETPTMDQETPGTNQETPTANQETPAANQETPTANQETPETPTTNQETPAANQETPTTNQETPTANQETPTMDQETLTMDQETPTANQETPAAEQGAANSQARTPAYPELCDHLVPGHSLDVVPDPSEWDSRPEAELVAWGAGHTDEQEGAYPDNPALTTLGPPWRECPAGTPQPQEEPQERHGQAGCMHPQGAPGWEGQGQQEVGFQKVQELTDKQVNGRRGEQRQNAEQGQEGLGTRGLGGLTQGQWGQEENAARPQGPRRGGQGEAGEMPGPEENEVDAQPEEKLEEVPGKQEDQGLGRELIPVEEWGEEAGVSEGEEAGVGEGEPGDQAGDRLGAGEEQAEHNGPSTVAPRPPGIPPPCDVFFKASCPITGVPQAQIDSWAGDMSPSSPVPAWVSSDKDASQKGQGEGHKQGPGARAISASTLGTPPWTLDSAPGSPTQVSPCSITSLPASPAEEIRPATGSPEASRASLSMDSPILCEALETPMATPRGSPSTEATWDLCPSPSGSRPQSSLASPSGSPLQSPVAGPSGSPLQNPVASPSEVGPHLRSSSFTGPPRTKLPPDLAARSLSFSHSEPPQRPPKPAIYGSVTPRRNRRSGRDSSITLEPPTASPALWQSLGVPHSQPEGPGGAHPCQHSSAPAPPLVSVDRRVPEPPPPLEKRHVLSPTGERDTCLQTMPPTLQQPSYPAPLALGSGFHGTPKVPADPLVARQLRPLPSTLDLPHSTQTSLPPRHRYNKPLPPTPDGPQPLPSPSSSSRSPRTYKPLPPLPTLDPPTEPPPLPPKARARSRSTQRALMSAGGQARLRPGSQDWSAALAPLAGHTSWPPATGLSPNPLAPASRGRSDMAPSMAFSNVTNLLSLSSPTTAWPPEEGSWLTEETGGPTRGPSKRETTQEGANSPQGSELGWARPPERPGHHPLEKSSSWPHRRDTGRPLPGVSGTALREGHSKSKGWNRQGLRRPSILSEDASGTRGPAMERAPGPSDTIIFREKKPKEASGGFSRRCSKLINSSQLLYQEYSDVFLNKEIQSQQRPDSLAEPPGLASPRQPRKALVSSESYLQRLSSASSSSLWQEIPVVRNSTVLLSMTHEDQKLQEAKFELIISEASYLRSLNVAVDHFQLSTQLRAALSNQDHQWLFSRLQDVRDVSATFLSDLEENFENNIFTFHVCDVVLNHAPHFRRVYLPYVTNQTYQERTFQSLLNSNSHFREVLERLESDPVCQRLSLKSFLILPFQRITRLKLLLQNILKRTQPGSLEEAEATKAHHALEELIRDCNSNVQRMRRTEELIYLSQKIEFECRIFPLISQSRWLVKSGELTALEFSASPGLRRKLNTRPVHLHLFNDRLLLSRPREGSRFLVFDHAPFSAVRGEKCEMKLHGAHKNLFRLFLLHNTQGSQAEFLFRTETQSEKLRWISALALPKEEMDLLECYDSPQVQCLRAYKPRENDELALEKADVVMVTQQSSDGWLEGVRLSDGERGWFPQQQVEFISNRDVCARNLKEAQRVKTARLQLVEQQA
ncbi:rho guanine nucleotide exchange factor 5 [Trichechus manatus latirostris]|uniref:Rho guanine nucleotide exchange factor 5 n=1 Tax=Trichechus manatus latirostris TaxID=127582 RepID=A0A2Y9DWQ1_TRIMA|nr:rho guanine nucleotide exchange factor 5 [Trichechus manatus latirostris]